MSKPEREPETLEELREAVAAHRRLLRTCDSQKTAVAWMAKAHELMGVCMDKLAEPPRPLIALPAAPRLVVVSSMGEAIKHAQAPKRPGFFSPAAKTFVYPERPDPPPGSRLAPRAWTHADTLRLEKENALRKQATTHGKKYIQRLGQ